MPDSDLPDVNDLDTYPDDEQDLVSDPYIYDEVARLYRETLFAGEAVDPEWLNHQIELEAARLTEMAEELMGDSAHGPLVKQWRDTHPGQDLDHRQQAALMNTARLTAREVVLAQQLYPKVDTAAVHRDVAGEDT